MILITNPKNILVPLNYMRIVSLDKSLSLISKSHDSPSSFHNEGFHSLMNIIADDSEDCSQEYLTCT